MVNFENDFVDLTSPSPVPIPSLSIGITAPIHMRYEPDDDLPVKDLRVSSLPNPELPIDASNQARSNSLTKAQRTVVALAQKGLSFFFTGCAGTGKTFTLKSIIEALPQGVTYVTAMTGIASSLLPHGTTLHSFAGIGHGEGPRAQILKKVKSSGASANKWRTAQTLIIDEVSMLSDELFELLDYIGREMRSRKSKPFGGLQVICCGDFFQLPPVSKKITNYCFESPVWAELMEGRVYELLDIFRQKDERLITLLNEVRHGNISEQTVQLVNSLRRDIVLPSGIVPTLLVPVNSIADSINIRELEKLPPTPSQMFQCNDWAIDAFTLDMLPKITLFPERLVLRVGAQVMLLKNNATLKLWNGSRGVVVGFRDYDNKEKGGALSAIGHFPAVYKTYPVVRFSTGQEILIGVDGFELQGFGKKETLRAKRSQLPLRLSWAITIHKSQGMSLDFLKVDAARSFEAGQAYVALSRARTVEGLQILSFDPRKCWCDPKVVRFYSESVNKLTDATCDAALRMEVVPSCTQVKKVVSSSTDWVKKPANDFSSWMSQPVASKPSSIFDVMKTITNERMTAPVPTYSASPAFESYSADIPPAPPSNKRARKF